MLAKSLAPWLYRRGIHYGWVMLVVTFLVSLSMAAAMGMPGVLMLPLKQEFGWDLTSIGGPLALRLLLFGLMAPFAAAIMQRYGLRATVVIALALVLSGFFLAMRMTSIWHLWVTWGVMAGIGTGLTAMVLGATVASRWFTQRRGLVMGILAAATATGQLAFLPVAEMLNDAYGWRVALMPVCAACVVAAILMVIFATDHPSDVGLPSFGESEVAPARPRAGNAALAAWQALVAGSGSGVFWTLFFTFFVCGLSTNGLIQTHFIALCADYDIPGLRAAGLLGAMGICDIFGTIGSGYLSDRVDSRKLLFWYYGLRGLALMFLPFSGFTGAGLAVFTVFYGLDWIATVPPTVRLSAQHFGRERGPVIFGWVFTGHQLGAAVAAYGGAMSRDAFQSYLPAFMFAGAACILASGAAISIRRIGGKTQTAAAAAATSA